MKLPQAALSIVAIIFAMSATPASAGAKGIFVKKNSLSKAISKGKIPLPKPGKLPLPKPGKL